MRIAHSMTPRWAPELVFTEPWPKFPEVKILLTAYDGGIKEYRGKWHIPGGYRQCGGREF